MTRAADRLGAGSFGRTQGVSARRAAIAAATEAPTVGAHHPAPPELPLSAISQNPDNPREKVGDVSDLASTLLEVGLVQAITVATVEAYLKVRPERADELDEGAEYVVVDGHRRHAAAREAGLETVKYVVNDDFVSSDESLLEAAFVANYQRENLSDLEEAAALEKLVKHYGSQGKAAKRLGVTQPFISQRLSLLELDPSLQADLEAGTRKVEHVRGLAKLSPEEQRQKANERAEEARRKADGRARRSKAGKEPAETSRASSNTATHNGVMRSTAQDSRSSSSSAQLPAARTAASAPAGTPAAEPLEGSVVTDMPWDNPQELLQILRDRMQPEHLKQLSTGLLEFV
ncbi:ParB/RepB/Spo0J family partition protein [Streptomyces sp. NPDC051162]|uniref:ParB/RepB/Spo0J family partition protein n=1 Tax=Streptomyces sp. NPDC051162 TaxID=3154747 RepID=UPI003414A487